MREAVIVSTARTPIGRAYRGAFNDTQAQALGGHVVAEAVRRAGIDPTEVEDVVLGAALQQGSSGINVAGAMRLARELGPGKVIVTILADLGQRYQGKMFNPEFLREKGLPTPPWM